MDSIVFGRQAGINAARTAKARDLVFLGSRPSEARTFLSSICTYRATRSYGQLSGVQADLKRLFWDRLGPVRCREGLTTALDLLQCLREDLLGCKTEDRVSQSTEEICASVDLYGAVLVGLTMAKSALLREETRGSHYRMDFPKPNPMLQTTAPVPCAVAVLDKDGVDAYWQNAD